MKKYIFLLYCVFAHAQERAWVIVPVADLFTAPQTQENIAYSGIGKQPWKYCPRVHQLLFNEQVIINKEIDSWAYITILHAYMLSPKTNEKLAQFWIEKKNLITETNLKKHKLAPELFPEPIDAQNNHVPHNHIITLTQPWYDTVTKCTYSAGTRFVHVLRNKHVTKVRIYHPQKQTSITRAIPHHLCIRQLPTSKHEKQLMLINLLTTWANNQHGAIPYVWGGTSFTERLEPNNYTIHTDGTITRDQHMTGVKTGFDCAGLILRAAQIVGIPYFCKNTTTLRKELPQSQTAHPGTLICFSGHVLIIANNHEHEIIEARSYDHGYGFVHKKPVNTIFSEIHTLYDIALSGKNTPPLKRLDNKGNIADIFPTYALCALPIN